MAVADDLDGFTHHTADVNGVRLHYVRGGQGDPLLLWHGFLETWYCWRKVMPALAKRFTVIAPDMRGYGDSDKPDGGYDGLTLAEDFRALVHNLGFSQVFIAAHDMGAPPALIYAGAYPQEVRALAYLDEPVLLTGDVQEALKFAPETAKNGGLWWWPFALVPALPETLIAGREREFLGWFYDHYTVSRDAVDEAALSEYLRTFAAPGGIAGSLGVYRSVFQTIGQTAGFARRKLPMPVLGLGGDKSMGGRTAEMLGGVASDVRGGAVPDCGHFIPDEQPEYLTAQLISFFTA